MGKLSLTTTTTTAAAVAFLTASLAPAQPAAPERIVEPPVHEQSVTGTFFNLTPSVDFERAAITVAGPKGYAFSDVVPGNGHVSVDLAHEPLPLEEERKGDVGVEGVDNPGTLPDGKYNYEVVLYHADGTSTRVSGTFRVEGGSALESRVYPGIPGSQQLTSVEGPGVLSRLIGAVLDFVVPSARSRQFVDDEIEIFDAEEDRFTFLNLRNHNGNTWGLRNDNGLLRFAVTNGGTPMAITSSGNVGIGTTAPAAKLMVEGDTGATALRVRLGPSSKLRVNSNGGVAVGDNFSGDDTPDDGLRVSGDTRLDGGLTVLTGTELNGGLTVTGNTGVVGDLRLTGATPAIFFDNTNGDKISWRIGEANDDLGIRQVGVAGAGGVRMSIEEGGNIGMGTTSPDAPLHVARLNGTAQVLVEDIGGDSPASPLQMFRLINEGLPAFNLTDDSQADVSWTFRLSGTQESDERFTITKLGTGQPEFALFADGSAEFQGDVTADGVLLTSSREMKTGFSPVDEHTVLKKVASLDVSQWRYKREPGTERHIGPMAEDFREVFGLGDGRHISAGDAQGILFAAAKALKQENETLREELAGLKAAVADLQAGSE